MSINKQNTETGKAENIGVLIAVFLVLVFLAGFGYGQYRCDGLADKEVNRVAARQITRFKVTNIMVQNQETVALQVISPDGSENFSVSIGHPYFDRFLKLKPNDVISAQWAWTIPKAQQMNDRVYKHCQIYPWDITSSAIKQPAVEKQAK